MKLLSSFLSIMLLLASVQCCNDEYALEMPDITSTGENTFGCYVNDELFIGHMSEGTLFSPGLLVQYYIDQNMLKIYATAKDRRNMALCDTVVAVGEKVRLKLAGYSNYNTGQAYEYHSDKDDGGDGEILLTRFELDPEREGIVKGMVSGRFSFRAKSTPRRDYAEDSVSVTEGRFDLKIFGGHLY